MTKKTDIHSKKYHGFYMELAETAAKQSVARRRKVGAVFVLPTGLIATGWNGTAPGEDNCCEYECEKTNHVYLPNLETKPDVIHAEQNALNKLSLQRISPKGSILFVTTAPCEDCAESLIKAGIKEVYFKNNQSTSAGPELLWEAGIPTIKY